MTKNRKHSLLALLALAAITILFAGCSKAPPTVLQNDPVSFQVLEDARAQAIANATFNANKYLAENPRFDSHSVIPHGDTTQSNLCPQGDGWATFTIMAVVPGARPDGRPGKNVEKYAVKCSTVSPNLGCYLDEDFKKKQTLAQEDGVCQPLAKVPFPLPKFGGAK